MITIEWGNMQDFKILDKEIKGSFPYENKIWRIRENEKLLAIINFRGYNGIDIEMDIWSCDSKWLTLSNIKKVFTYIFKNLNCKRCSASTSKSNLKTRNFLEKLGFKWEGTRRIALDGENQMDYGMLKSECIWLKPKEEIKKIKIKG